MWVYQYQPLLNGLLQKALVELCTQSLPWEGRLEIDGIFCVSGKDPSQQIVIKIHKALEKPEPIKNQPSRPNNQSQGAIPNKKVVIEAGKIVSSGNAPKKSQKSPQEKSMPLNLSLPNLKSGGSVTQHISPAVSKAITNQSLRALLGTKSTETLLAGGFPQVDGAFGLPDVPFGHDGQPTILKQPQPVWLRKDGEPGIPSERRDVQDYYSVKEEPLDVESESSQDLDEETLPATNVHCKVCNLTFENFTRLKSHTMEVHKRYACRQCCNTFSMSCNLRRHERLHAGVKPHNCNFCKKTFSRAADLRLHIRKHAEEKMPEWISCSKCPKAFRTAVNLRLHMFKVHKETSSIYACSICEKIFEDPNEFQLHRESHTASLVQSGQRGKDTDSVSSLPLVNGSQDSMDEDAISSAVSDNDHGTELDLSVYQSSVQNPRLSELSHEFMDASSPASFTKSMSPYPESSPSIHKSQDEEESLGLYFGSPLVIKEENDSNDGDSQKRTNRRKSKPNKVTAGMPVEMEEDAENMEPRANADGGPLEADAVANGEMGRKRDASDIAGLSEDSHLAKRPRVMPPMGSFMPGLMQGGLLNMLAEQSLESIMKQVNENLYQNQDVITAEAKEKSDSKKKAKPRPKPKAKKSVTPSPKPSIQPIASSSAWRPLEPKAPIYVMVGNSPGVNSYSNTPKTIGQPQTATLKLSLKKENLEKDSWSVSPKQETIFSPVDPFTVGDIENKTFTCIQFGCQFSVIGFKAFEDHMLTIHGRYPCKYCSSTFTGRNNRTRHVRYHFTGKQHQCPQCSKYFARPDSLKEHRFIHTKSYRDSVCCNCKVNFEKKATLLAHMKRCFTDEQLDSDKMTPEEIEMALTVSVKKEKSATPQTASPANLNTTSDSAAPSDIGVMKAEYLRQEKEKILNVKNYLDMQMCASPTLANKSPSIQGEDELHAMPPTLPPIAPLDLDQDNHVDGDSSYMKPINIEPLDDHSLQVTPINVQPLDDADDSEPDLDLPPPQSLIWSAEEMQNSEISNSEEVAMENVSEDPQAWSENEPDVVTENIPEEHSDTVSEATAPSEATEGYEEVGTVSEATVPSEATEGYVEMGTESEATAPFEAMEHYEGMGTVSEATAPFEATEGYEEMGMPQ